MQSSAQCSSEESLYVTNYVGFKELEMGFISFYQRHKHVLLNVLRNCIILVELYVYFSCTSFLCETFF